MEYRRFGKTALDLSVFSVGTMRFLHGWDEPHDHLPDDSLENTREVLQAAFDVGINLIETAHGYGKSERLIGQTLPHLRPPGVDWHIMTKAKPTESAGEMRRQVEQSLERLKVDRVALFAFHGVNTRDHLELALRPGGCFQALERMREEGLIGHLGFSSHAPPPVLFDAITSGAFDFVNLHYYAFRPANRVAVALAAARDMGVFIISPNEKGGGLYTPPAKLQSLTSPLHPVQYNERWLLSQPEVHILSVGPSLPEHLDIHLTSLGNPPYWGENERKAALALARETAQSPLSRCGICTRCLPCPEKIDIPEMFRLFQMADTFNMVPHARFRYGLMKPNDHWIPGAKGDQCSRCGECLPRCPQGLAIPELLLQAHKKMQPLEEN
ncbi:MAG: aldo/keto reductase [Magnetococcales bacterium]|nr:aldo/keto reductase [Magnetococcales bacterium]